ncbi:MAG: mechanosensitive ion channel [Novosphingobium sp.]|nr:mechanosensitive ion channel [Novosphingobium sp.]
MEELFGRLNGPIDFALWSDALIALAVLAVIALTASLLTRLVVVRLIERLIEHTSLRKESVSIGKMVRHFSNVVPAIVIAEGIGLVPNLPAQMVLAVESITSAFIVFTLARVFSDFLSVCNELYENQPDASGRPIKGYIQLGKIGIYGAAAILIVAQLLGQSPLLLLSGLGALAAVLMLIFRDTLLSLVASVQLQSNDMLRVGDWIEMPQLNADGDVIDVALHTVKVQNFDKTVTAIPTHRFISDSFRNYRFMKKWGGRRIKRAINIDQASISFLSDDQWQALRRFTLLGPYMDAKEAELAEWNAKQAEESEEEVNQRRPTNFGSLRAYIIAYLKAHPHITQRGTLLVRHRDPTDLGMPLEIYCFTDTPVWAEYESIQADIFDHLLAIMPEFGLHAFQQPSGTDVRDSAGAGAGAA